MMESGAKATEDEPSGNLKKVPGLSNDDLEKSKKGDDASVWEAEQLSLDSLEEEARRNEHKRSEKFKNHFERIAIIILWNIAIAIGFIFWAWICHLILWEKCHWLSNDQIGQLQTILVGVGGVSGILSTIAAKHLKKRLD